MGHLVVVSYDSSSLDDEMVVVDWWFVKNLQFHRGDWIVLELKEKEITNVKVGWFRGYIVQPHVISYYSYIHNNNSFRVISGLYNRDRMIGKANLIL